MDYHEASRRQSITELVEHCLSGDAESWRELMQRYANLVHSVPVRYGLTPMEVDDVGQEVFLILAQNLHQVDDPERLPAWLLTTARRVTWRALQKRRREQPADTGDLTEDPTGPATKQSAESGTALQILGSTLPTMQELLEGWIYQEALHQGLERLGEPCRRLLTLLFLDPEEPSYDKIGKRLKMPLGSIGPTRNRCLRKLRTILEGLGFDDGP